MQEQNMSVKKNRSSPSEHEQKIKILVEHLTKNTNKKSAKRSKKMTLRKNAGICRYKKNKKATQVK